MVDFICKNGVRLQNGDYVDVYKNPSFMVFTKTSGFVRITDNIIDILDENGNILHKNNSIHEHWFDFKYQNNRKLTEFELYCSFCTSAMFDNNSTRNRDDLTRYYKDKTLKFGWFMVSFDVTRTNGWWSDYEGVEFLGMINDKLTEITPVKSFKTKYLKVGRSLPITDVCLL